jgi:hypothetical protein
MQKMDNIFFGELGVPNLHLLVQIILNDTND